MEMWGGEAAAAEDVFVEQQYLGMLSPPRAEHHSRM